MPDWKDFESAEDYHNLKRVARVVMLMQKTPKYSVFFILFA